MSQLRKDPITGRWIIVNVENPSYAEDYSVEPPEKSSKTCPFCPGNEAMTPPEIFAAGRKSGAKNTPGWSLRVVPNKFPALKIEESTEKVAIGIYDRIGGFGAHEIIIESPDHDKDLADLAPEQVELVLKTYRERCMDLRKDARIQYILIFKNHGAAAGASLEHPHSQLIGLPIVPSRVLGEMKGGEKHFEYTDRCIFCDILSQERFDHKLTVLETEQFIAMEPFVSRFPFETWILPKVHAAAFDTIADASLKELADVLKKSLFKIKTVLKDPPFNFMIHTHPIQEPDSDHFHWHIEITPQLTKVAGFEWGTGFYVNPTPPELAAQILKKAPGTLL